MVEIIKALQAEMARVKEILNSDSKTSSKPPSQDIIKKSEKKKTPLKAEATKPKRKPGGQPGHPGKTRKGFGRVDRIEDLRVPLCPHCGGTHLTTREEVEIQPVAQLVVNPIEIVEYHRHRYQCQQCGTTSVADWSEAMVPGQDLGIRLQALVGWLGNYAHVPYAKIRELLRELGQIEIGEGTLVATNQRVAQAIATGQDNASIGQVFVDLIDDVFANYRSLQLSNNLVAYHDWATQFQEKLTQALSLWIPKAGATARHLLSKLRHQAQQWWYCLDHPEVPPDNNLAERALRLAVTKRKVSAGSRSLSRFGDTATLLTVVQTCRTQGRSVINFFVSALRAQAGHQLAYPSLIPVSPT